MAPFRRVTRIRLSSNVLYGALSPPSFEHIIMLAGLGWTKTRGGHRRHGPG
jgi:hypothetical protein